MHNNIEGKILLAIRVPRPAWTHVKKLIQIYVADGEGVRWQNRNTVTNMDVLDIKMGKKTANLYHGMSGFLI